MFKNQLSKLLRSTVNILFLTPPFMLIVFKWGFYVVKRMLQRFHSVQLRHIVDPCRPDLCICTKPVAWMNITLKT